MVPQSSTLTTIAGTLIEMRSEGVLSEFLTMKLNGPVVNKKKR